MGRAGYALCLERIQMKILIIKGNIGSVRISNTTLPLLQPVDVHHQQASAIVDASSVLGDQFKRCTINLHLYRLIR